jgi:hypothetical protein
MVNNIKPLNPKKYTVKKVFREYQQKEPVVKPKREPFYLEIPKGSKKCLDKIYDFFIFHWKIILIFVLLLFICLVGYFFFLKPVPKLNFIDSLSGDNIQGYVYLDDVLLGDTNGIEFDGLPQDFCLGSHIIKLDYGEGSFEWQTYSVDCRYKQITFEVDHEKALSSEEVIFKFLDETGSYYIAGKMYLNGAYVMPVDKLVSFSREECKNITQVKLELDDFFSEWENNPEFCDTNNEIVFKVATKR